MKNKKVITILAALGLFAMQSLGASAMTNAVENKDGTISYHQVIDGRTPEYTGGDAERYEKYVRQQNKEDLAYLEKYGVSYDMEDGAVYYQGEKVRWLVDETAFGDITSTYYTPDGTIDLYTVRDEDCVLIGVRKATEEEFKEKKAPESEAENIRIYEGTLAAEQEDLIQEAEIFAEKNGTGATATYTLAGGDSLEVEVELPDEESVEKGTAIESAADYTGKAYDFSEEATFSEGEAHSIAEMQAEFDREVQEYESIGLVYDKNSGYYTWKGEKVFLILDDDGSLSTFGNNDDKKSRIYVHIVRDDSGKAVEAEVVSARELLEIEALKAAED